VVRGCGALQEGGGAVQEDAPRPTTPTVLQVTDPWFPGFQVCCTGVFYSPGSQGRPTSSDPSAANMGDRGPTISTLGLDANTDASLS